MKRTRALAVLLSLSMALQPIVSVQAAEPTAAVENVGKIGGVTD